MTSNVNTSASGRLRLPSLFTLLLILSTIASGASLHNSHQKFHNRLAEKGIQLGSAAQGVAQQSFKAMAYYVNWAIYARNFPPQDLQTSELTHVLYAFAGINNQTGEAYLTDTWADVEKMWPGDVVATPVNNMTNTTETDLFGNLKQLYLLKKRNRNLKTLLSIGGWSLRGAFAPALTKSTVARRRFAKSSVGLLKDLGFDGLDIDWEYPASPQEAAALVSTVALFRSELDAYASTLPSNPHFLLSLAVPAGPDHFQYFDIPALEPYVDFLMLMAYDYQGSFSNYSGHNSNLYKSLRNPRSTDFDTQTAVEYYFEGGVLPREKFVLGMPLYGRSFANTSGPGGRFSPAKDGSWEAGVWDYKALPLNSSSTTVHTNANIVASWSYDNHSHYMVSYDTPFIAAQKAKYIETHGFGGAMWWETSGDRPLNSSRSLIRTVTDSFKQCGAIEWCENVLEYPFSQYRNLREEMPGE